jgi:hypothetical protein
MVVDDSAVRATTPPGKRVVAFPPDMGPPLMSVLPAPGAADARRTGFRTQEATGRVEA